MIKAFGISFISILLSVSAWIPTFAGTINYTYDDAGRMIEAVYEDGSSITYTYDDNGNLLERVADVLSYHTLNIETVGAASGTVTSTPGGINCGDTCTASFKKDSSITLTAIADEEAVFSGWSGGGCTGTGTCTVIMTDDTTVTATFRPFEPEPVYHTLAIETAGAGSGTVTSTPGGINCGGTCTASFEKDSAVILTAIADEEAVFSGWSGGGCTGTGTCTVVMTDDTTVTANFRALEPEPVYHALSIGTAGTGSGTVTSNPDGINCGDTCTASFEKDSTITLTAIADENAVFTGWSGGDCTGTGTCTVIMTGDTAVTASFRALEPGTIAFVQSAYSVQEDAGSLTISVNRSADTDGTVTARCLSMEATASDGEDYQGIDRTLTWGDGEDGTQTVTITILDDLRVEGPEIINLVLSNITGGVELGDPATCTVTIEDNEMDEDGDGISDETEKQGPNNGDADGNGVDDYQEANVTSFESITGNYLTLTSTANTTLTKVSIQENPSPEDAPADTLFPEGFFDFAVTNVNSGDCIEVTLLLSLNEKINGYYKYGPTPDDPTNHWYLFDMDGNTGAEIFHEENQTRIVLHLCDGQRGDDDLTVNGEIDDIGSPAIAPQSTPEDNHENGDGDDSTCFISTLFN